MERHRVYVAYDTITVAGFVVELFSQLGLVADHFVMLLGGKPLNQGFERLAAYGARGSTVVMQPRLRGGVAKRAFKKTKKNTKNCGARTHQKGRFLHTSDAADHINNYHRGHSRHNQ